MAVYDIPIPDVYNRENPRSRSTKRTIQRADNATRTKTGNDSTQGCSPERLNGKKGTASSGSLDVHGDHANRNKRKQDASMKKAS